MVDLPNQEVHTDASGSQIQGLKCGDSFGDRLDAWQSIRNFDFSRKPFSADSLEPVAIQRKHLKACTAVLEPLLGLGVPVAG
jgi:hypothetical protein